MPPVIIPLASALATQIGTGVAFTVLGTSVSYGALIAGALSIGGSLLASKGGKGGGGGGAQEPLPLIDTGRKLNTVNSTDYRQIIYGKTRKKGTYLFTKVTSSGINNKGDRKTSRDCYLHQIVGFASHECEEFVNLYLNDILLIVDSDGWVTNTRYTKNSDTEDAKGADAYAATLDTTANASGSGTTATLLIDDALATVNGFIEAGELIQILGFSDAAYNGQFVVTSTADAGGGQTNIVYETDVTITDAAPSQLSATLDVNPIGYRGTTAYVYTSTDHELSVGNKMYVFNADPDEFNSEKQNVLTAPTPRTFTYELDSENLPTEIALSASYQRRNGTDEALVNVQTFTGSDSQDLSSNTFIDEALSGQFSSTDNYKGICCAYIRAFDASEFDSSVQLTAEIKGKNNIFDCRDGEFKYSSNAVLCLLDYLTGTFNGVPYGTGLQIDTGANTSNDINLDNFSVEANRCEESVELLDGSFVQRYITNGTINTSEQYIDAITLLSSSFMGNATTYDGKVNVWAAHYEIPTHHIDEDWFSDSTLKLAIANDQQDLLNGARGVINNEAELYNADDFPKYSDTAAVTADGKEFNDDIQMPYVKNIESAQRLAKIFVQNARKRMTIQCTLNARGLMLVPNDTVFLSFDKYNFVNKVFKVGKISVNLQTLEVSVTLKEDGADVYEWDANEAS